MTKIFPTSAMFLMAGIAQAVAAAPVSYVIANNTPRFVTVGETGTAVDPSQMMEVTVWLYPHNRAALDSTAAQLYDRNSPSYHQWLSREAIGRLIAPSDSEAADVSRFLQSAGLEVLRRDKFNLYVRARGTAATVQKAFHVTLADVTVGKNTYRTNLADPTIADPAGAKVMVIQGLDNISFEHQNIAQTDAIKGLKLPATRPGVTDAASGTPTACITGTGTETYVSSDGSRTIATYTGNLYTKHPLGCGYTPPQIRAAYGLDKLYAAGFDGTGQTIVIPDWCGSPTINRDANAFSARYGLPPLTPGNFSIVDYPGTSTCSSFDPEINIDVEWAHAIAPGANILLLVPPTPTFQDVDAALLYIVETNLGGVVSNSFGSAELYIPPSVVQLQSFIVEAAATAGIAMNFSSGDQGDYTFDQPEIFPPSVLSPADSPYATAIGGVSLQLTAASKIQFQTAWGTNETVLDQQGLISVPAANIGSAGGSGGGTSVMFPKLAYQAALRGKYRKVPDISWLADPFTGGVIAISEPSQSPSLVYAVYGGTSLACPMFSGLWAIANQVAGARLGQAAPLLYAAPSSAITDIVPHGSATNVTAAFQLSDGTRRGESAAKLAGPLRGNTSFISALWTLPDNPDFNLLITFGTDTGLRPAPGWDDATGLGVANPAALISFLAPAAVTR